MSTGNNDAPNTGRVEDEAVNQEHDITTGLVAAVGVAE